MKPHSPSSSQPKLVPPPPQIEEMPALVVPSGARPPLPQPPQTGHLPPPSLIVRLSTTTPNSVTPPPLSVTTSEKQQMEHLRPSMAASAAASFQMPPPKPAQKRTRDDDDDHEESIVGDAAPEDVTQLKTRALALTIRIEKELEGDPAFGFVIPKLMFLHGFRSPDGIRAALRWVRFLVGNLLIWETYPDMNVDGAETPKKTIADLRKYVDELRDFLVVFKVARNKLGTTVAQLQHQPRYQRFRTAAMGGCLKPVHSDCKHSVFGDANEAVALFLLPIVLTDETCRAIIEKTPTAPPGKKARLE